MKQVCGIWFPENDEHFKLGMLDKKGNYQKDIFDAAMVHIKEAKVFIDIGAHVGTWTLMAARAGFKEINAFEPNPITFECLKKNVAEKITDSKNLGIKIVVHNFGASSKEQKLFLHEEDKSNSGAVSLRANGSNKVDVYALDEIKEEYWNYASLLPHESLIKIDIEGMEAECIKGMADIIQDMKPVMCVEQRTNNNALEILQKMGMQIVQQVRKDYILTWKSQ